MTIASLAHLASGALAVLIAGAFTLGGKLFGGYQTLINDTLRRVIESEHIEADLRAVIRKELAQRFG